MSDGLAEIFQNTPLGPTLSLPTADTPVLYKTGNDGLQGPNDIVISDAINGRFVIGPTGQGKYDITLSITFGASKRSLCKAEIFVNGILQPNLFCAREIANPLDVGNVSTSGFLFLEADDEITLQFESDTPNTDISILHVNVTIKTAVRDIVP